MKEKNLPNDPLFLFEEWYQAAQANDLIKENTAMALTTVNGQGIPTTRMVLLKGFDNRGFVFYTNYQSRKAQDIQANPHVALLFWWQPLYKQIRIQGVAEKLDARESDAYFQSRPRGSQIGAIISPQSQSIPNRNYLEEQYSQIESKYSNMTIPRPEYWGGYLIKPFTYEFWEGQNNRLHDRFSYRLENENWLLERLAP